MEDSFIHDTQDVDQSDRPEAPYPASPFFSTYNDFIASRYLVQPELGWWRNFVLKPGAEPSQTETTIFDTIDGSIIERACFTTDTTGLSEVLNSRKEEVNTRLIIVCHPLHYGVDKLVADKLGMAFDIDPHFLCRLFSYAGKRFQNKKEAPLKDFNDARPYVLPSEIPGHNQPRLVQLLSFQVTVSALVYQNPVSLKATILLWILVDTSNIFAWFQPFGHERRSIMNPPPQEHIRHKTFAAAYIAGLRELSRDQVKSADLEPFYYIYPCFRFGLLGHYTYFLTEFDCERMDNLDKCFEEDNDDPLRTRLSDLLRNIQYYLRNLYQMEREVGWICKMLKPSEIATKFEFLKNGITLLHSRFERSTNVYKDAMHAALVAKQLEEAMVSRNVAITVGRLSKLAFIFIPLSFTTSVFGVNVSEFGQGTVSLKTFFLTAAAVSTFALIPIAYTMWNGLRKSFRDYKNSPTTIGIALRLARYSPRLALWLILFSVSHKYNGPCLKIVHTALEEEGNMEYDEVEGVYHGVRISWLPDFWEKKLRIIFAFVSQDHLRAWRPWRPKQNEAEGD